MLIQTFQNLGIQYLHLNDPTSGNALGLKMGLALSRILEPLHEKLQRTYENHHETRDLRALVITAELGGPKHDLWIAGGHLRELAELTDPRDGVAYAQVMTRVCHILETLPIPVIAAISGRAIGGGAEFALAADLRLGTPDATFEFVQNKLGLVTGYDGTRRLVQLVGKSFAAKYLLLCSTICTEEAERVGLLHEVVANATDLKKRIEEISAAFKTLSRQTLAYQKKLLQSYDLPLNHVEKTSFAKLWMAPTHQAALSKFARGLSSI